MGEVALGAALLTGCFVFVGWYCFTIGHLRGERAVLKEWTAETQWRRKHGI